MGLLGLLGADRSGTLASFSAETTNAGSTIASGTLALSNAVNSGTACLSSSTTTNLNANCSAILTLSNIEPGQWGSTQTATVTLIDTGSLPASHLFLWAPSSTNCVDTQTSTEPNGGVVGTSLSFNGAATTTLTSGITNGASVSTLAVAALPGPIQSGDSVVVTSSTSATQTFTASAAAPSGATSISVSTATATAAFPTGSAVQDAPLCAATLMFIQEQATVGNSTDYYCWFGNILQTAPSTYGSAPTNGASEAASNGQCTQPVTTTLTAGLNSGTAYTSLSVAALPGAVASGDSILVNNGSDSQTFTASAGAAAGATSISVSSVSANANYASGNSVSDTNSYSPLNADTTDTIGNFDSQHTVTLGKIALYPISGAGTVDTNASTGLGVGSSNKRVFTVGLYLPAPTGGNQNKIQGLQSTFGLTWHIDQ